MNANNVPFRGRQGELSHAGGALRRGAGSQLARHREGAVGSDLTERCCHVFRQGFIRSHETEELREWKRQNICGGQIWLLLKSNFSIRLGAQLESGGGGETKLGR